MLKVIIDKNENFEKALIQKNLSQIYNFESKYQFKLFGLSLFQLSASLIFYFSGKKPFDYENFQFQIVQPLGSSEN